MYVLRDVLQFATNLSSATEILYNAHRTWEVHLGVGSLADNELLGYGYSAKQMWVFDAMNNTWQGTLIPGILFYGDGDCLIPHI